MFSVIHRLLDSMKQRSSSFQISDILGLPSKDQHHGEDSNTTSQTTIPPPTLSSALHSSNNLYYSNFSTSSYPPPPALPLAPLAPNSHHPPPTTPYDSQSLQDPNPMQLSSPSSPSESGPTSPAFVAGQLNKTLIDSKHLTGGYLPANLSSSMFLESSAAHYNNLFHGRGWPLDNSNDHYGEFD